MPIRNLIGATPERLSDFLLAAEDRYVKATAPNVIFTDFHDLSYFAQCVVTIRSAVKRPLPVRLQTELQLRVIQGLHPEWIVDMRYRQTNVTQAEVSTALAHALWVKLNWTSST